MGSVLGSGVNKGLKPELMGRIEYTPGTCGFYDRLEERNRCLNVKIIAASE